jgi:hypothetical protein
MSKRYPECPLYNHDNCKDLHIPKVCAILREDKTCLRKYRKRRNTAGKSDTPSGLSLSPEFKEIVQRLKDKEPQLDTMAERGERT